MNAATAGMGANMPTRPSDSIRLSNGLSNRLKFGGAQADPFETISKFANIQNALIRNRLFQQSFSARKRMGQIFATTRTQRSAGKDNARPSGGSVCREVIGSTAVANC